MHKTDGIEIRLDCISNIDKDVLASFLQTTNQPVLFTLRKSAQGGFFKGAEEERLALFEDLLHLRPEFADIEYDTDPRFVKRIANKFPETKLILSYHNFENTPQDLENILKTMHSPYAYGYKIATYATSSLDALRMLLFTKTHPRVAGLCMGEEGTITRILSPVFGSLFNYTYEENQIAPGQLPVHTLLNTYNYKRLNPSTKLFGLIGDPVTHSIGHIVHNAAMKKLNFNAVYVKMRVQETEVQDFLDLAATCNFKGLSVTAPLKEKVLPGKVVNTLKDCFIGHNTDGTGCMDAIEAHIQIANARITILGTGGAAKAIAKESVARKAITTVYGRNFDKAHAIAQEIGCNASQNIDAYDVLINATSSLDPISLDCLIPKTYVMDIHTHPEFPPLLIEAKKRGCFPIFGREMFFHQAARQLHLWFEEPVSASFLCDLYRAELQA